MVVDRVGFPATITYWLILMVGMAWQTVVALWVISRQEGSLRCGIIRRATRLNRPCDPRTGRSSLLLFLGVLPVWPVVVFCLGLGILMPVWLFILGVFGSFDIYSIAVLRWPAYANITELASPEFAGQWQMVIVVLLAWVWGALFAEELFFRGVLLPRMRGVFGARDWIANALLYALYGLYQYWMIPFRFIEGLIITRYARRFSSTWMPVAIRCVEALILLGITLLGVVSRPLTASPVPIQFPYVSRHPAASVIYHRPMAAIPVANPGSGMPFQVDLRGADLSDLDLRNAGANLAYADFDSRTVWPATAQLPAEFDPVHIADLGKNPGLGLRALHRQGITGRGVGVAIVDQQLLVEHVEYAKRLRWYEEIPGGFEVPAQMHGPGVASLAVGRTIGVAPEADLYYIGGAGSGGLRSLFLFSHDYAQAVRRILQINEQLPAERKIRVISISAGLVQLPWIAGYQDFVIAVRKAEASGILVIDVATATGMPADTHLRGLGRLPTSDPDAFESYEPGIFWSGAYYAHEVQTRMLLAPMDSRTVASTAGPDDYAFSRIGGLSWVAPYVAGLYALAAQVDPAITPERFWSTALQTGRTVQLEHEGNRFSLGVIVDPSALVAELQKP